MKRLNNLELNKIIEAHPDGMSVEKVAEVMGCSAREVQQSLNNAYRELQLSGVLQKLRRIIPHAAVAISLLLAGCASNPQAPDISPEKSYSLTVHTSTSVTCNVDVYYKNYYNLPAFDSTAYKTTIIGQLDSVSIAVPESARVDITVFSSGIAAQTLFFLMVSDTLVSY